MTIDREDLYKAKDSINSALDVFDWAESTVLALMDAASESFQGSIFLNRVERLDWFKSDHTIINFNTPFGDGRLVLRWIAATNQRGERAFGGRALNAEVIAQARVLGEQFDTYTDLQTIRTYRPESADVNQGWVVNSGYHDTELEEDAWSGIIHRLVQRIKEQFENL